MKIIDSIRRAIPDFEFVRIDRIERLDIENRDGQIDIICDFVYFNGLKLQIDFLNAWNVKIVFDGGDMQLGEFFIAPLADSLNPAEGYRAWDELTGLEWKCENMLLLSISQP
jgi:hypothetical protein